MGSPSVCARADANLHTSALSVHACWAERVAIGRAIGIFWGPIRSYIFGVGDSHPLPRPTVCNRLYRQMSTRGNPRRSWGTRYKAGFFLADGSCHDFDGDGKLRAYLAQRMKKKKK